MSNNKLYVGNLSFKTTDDQLAQIFAEFGTVGRASVVTDRDTGRSRGFGFVEMGNDAEAQAAISALDGQMVDGRTLQVNVARPRENGGGGGGGGFRGGRGGGGGGWGGGGGGGGGGGWGGGGGGDRGDRGGRGGGRGGDRGGW
jgi:RNA recognition motif-containing protein